MTHINISIYDTREELMNTVVKLLYLKERTKDPEDRITIKQAADIIATMINGITKGD